jgi:catechol 2,3-dioxygenase
MVRLLVADLGRSIEYYERVIGLRVFDRTTDAATLAPHGDDHPCLALRTESGVSPARRGAFGLYHFAILLPDRSAFGRFARHLADLSVRAGMADHLVSEALYLSDPDGLGIEVYADRPRSAWHYRDREVIMTVDPLDLERILAAGGERPWNGAPAGTTIGHVHLHVGNLQRAEAFYHAGLGLDKMMWSYPGALFLAAGGYHHHLGANTWAPGPSPSHNQARLLEWELVVPDPDASSAAAQSLRAAGFPAEASGDGWVTADPWGTPLRIIAAIERAASAGQSR